MLDVFGMELILNFSQKRQDKIKMTVIRLF